MTTVLVVRLDSDGDVLLTGPAIRAVARPNRRVVALVGPRGAQAARMLPGVSETLVWHAPWIDPEPEPVRSADVDGLVTRIAALEADEALVFTSYHQSPLPTALLLRLAGVQRVSAISEDYPGSLLDVRHRVDDDLPEVERALSLAEAAGYRLRRGDDGRLRVRAGLPDGRALVRRFGGRISRDGYVVVHPGTSVPARAWPPFRHAEAVRLLTSEGYQVVVTGGPDETSLTAAVSGEHGIDLGGRTSFAQLGGVLARARALVVGNTGPAHLAAAVGTPVVSLFAPTVPAYRWAPYGVPVRLLGDQNAPCRGTRVAHCPVPGHPCLTEVRAPDVVAAVGELIDDRDAAAMAGARETAEVT